VNTDEKWKRLLLNPKTYLLLLLLLLLHRSKGPVHLLLLLLLLLLVLPFLNRHGDLGDVRVHFVIARVDVLGQDTPPAAPLLLLLLLLLLASTTPAPAALLLLLLLLLAAAPTIAVAIVLVALGVRVRDDGGSALVGLRLVLDEDPLVNVASKHGSQGHGRGKGCGENHTRKLHDLLE